MFSQSIRDDVIIEVLLSIHCVPFTKKHLGSKWEEIERDDVGKDMKLI